MLKIAICDDEADVLDTAYAMVKKYCAERIELDATVHKFRHGFRLLDAIAAHGRYDIYILDIIMPDMNGIELGAEIRKKDNDCRIILLTSSSEYGVDSYSIAAKDYVLKPYTEKSLFSALDKVVDSMSDEKAKRFLMKIPGGVYSLPYGKLLYLEYYKHRLIAHTIDGEEIESTVLREPFVQLASPLIEDERFIRISASYVINMQHVRRLTSQYFELSNGETLSISRLYANARSAYLDYMFEKGSSL